MMQPSWTRGGFFIFRPELSLLVAFSSFTSLWPQAASAHDDEERDPAAKTEEVVVLGNRGESAASELHLRGDELLTRPKRRPQDLLEAVPGLMTASHAGGGKATQYFLRGFDLDHGTDVAFFVDNMPVNQVSHGHGQGYTDLNFVIPELVSTLDVYKGSGEASFGDFATAGAIRFGYADLLPRNSVTFSVGQFGVLRGLGIYGANLDERNRVLVAAEASKQDGPFDHPEGMAKGNGVLRFTHDLSSKANITTSLMAYANRWNASGQIPLREVEAGRLSRFGSVDPSEGGQSSRYSLSSDLRARRGTLTAALGVYGIASSLRLDSNFTFYLADPIRGDGIEQKDDRNVFGGYGEIASHHHEGPFTFRTKAGVQSRFDSIKNGLFRQEKRTILATIREAEIGQGSLGAYLEEEISFRKLARLKVGARFDQAFADVRGESEADGGRAGAAIASPKASLVLSPLDELRLFTALSRGFHSNDVRGVILRTDPVTFLTPATNYELGLASELLGVVELKVAAFRLDIESEQVFVGDEGTTEPKGASSRHGLEFFARARYRDWFRCDASLTFTKATYRDNPSEFVALAPTRTLGAGCDTTLPSRTFGALRVRHLGDRAALEDGSIVAPGYTVLSLRIGQRFSLFEASIDFDNVTNEDYREVQFVTLTRLRGEASGVEGIHFVPGWPFNAKMNLAAHF